MVQTRSQWAKEREVKQARLEYLRERKKQADLKKKQEEDNKTNDAAKTLVNMSNTTVYIIEKNIAEETLKEAKEELRKLKLIKQYKSVHESLKKTMLETIKMIDEVNHEINQLMLEVN